MPRAIKDLYTVTRPNTAMSKKVIMFGGAGTDAPLPPIEPGVERWGLNNLVRVFPARFEGVTRWFDLHPKQYIVSPKSLGGRGGANMWGWYRTLDIPLYMWETHPDLPTSTVYPLQAVREMFGGTRLFNSSLDWQIALALYEGFDEIELYAFRMASTNYQHQVSTALWWLKQCADRGVTVTHLSPSSLAGISRVVGLKPPQPEPHHLMYGLDTTDRSKLYRGR